MSAGRTRGEGKRVMGGLEGIECGDDKVARNNRTVSVVRGGLLVNMVKMA